MTDSGIDWGEVRSEFMKSNLKLKDFSSLVTGRKKDPSYSRLRTIAGREGWVEQRNAIALAQKAAAALTPPIPPPEKVSPPPKITPKAIASLPMGNLASVASDLHRPPGMTHQGHYTDALPDAMQEGYDDAIADGELLGMRRDIALMDTLSRSLLRRMNEGEASARHWGRLRQLGKELSEAHVDRDMNVAAKKTNEILKAIALGCPEAELMSELLSVIRTRMNLIGSESKRLQALQAYALKQKQIQKDEKPEVRSAEGGDDSRGLGQESRDETMRRVWEIVT